jgi:hypothetical protein
LKNFDDYRRVAINQRYLHVKRYINWREISIGFAVRPRTLGNQIELEIAPRITKPNGQGIIDFEVLTTTLLA